MALLAHHHFGRIRPQHHTSYATLLFMILVTAVLVAAQGWAAQAATPAVNPQSGSVGLTGIVRGPAPSTAAVILVPTNGTSTSVVPVSVRGTCPANTFVSISKNGAFGGATTCQEDGTFTLLVDLFAGRNELVAKVSDALGQYGPDSAAVVITYNAPNTGSGSNVVLRQLFLNMAVTVVAGNPGTEVRRTVTIVGGTAPFALSFDYGDGQTGLVTATSEGDVTNAHTYDRPGYYTVVAKVSDSQGNSAYLQYVTIVNGALTTAGGTAATNTDKPGFIQLAWPLLGFAFMLVLAFWAGEWRESRKLAAKAQPAV